MTSSPARLTHLVALFAVVVVLGWLPFARALADEDQPDLYYAVESVNPGLPALAEAPNLETPLAAVEYFIDSCEAGEYERAAHALDFRLVSRVDDRLTPAETARRLHYVLLQELWVDWGSLPDRPDGMLEAGPLGQAPPLAGKPRRSMRLGWVSMPDRRVPVRLDRVKPRDGEPRWLVSAQTVVNVPMFYEQHGPKAIAQSMPEWARTRGPGRVPLWQLFAALLVTLTAIAVALVVAKWVVPLALRPWSSGWSGRLRWPTGTFAGLVVCWVGIAGLTSFPSAIASIVDPLLLIGVIFSGALVVMRVLSELIDRVAKSAVRSRIEDDDPAQGRVLTQLTVLRHACALAVFLIGVGVTLQQLALFETVGVALLTSAGAAAVVLGLAGHAVLGNLVASVQIALTQPFRLGDTVIVKDNWGRIEEITYSYVTIRTWDERRLVVPLRHFVTETFENWSKTDDFLIKPIYIHVDFRADVQRIREKFEELVASHEDLIVERTEAEVLVVATDGDNLKVRFTAGTNGVGQAWALSCALREELVAWLREVEGGEWLPRERFELSAEQGEVSIEARERGPSTDPDEGDESSGGESSGSPAKTSGGDGE